MFEWKHCFGIKRIIVCLCVCLQDISDGMPWCEERLVRKVLFLSLREFRDAHRAAHKHSYMHTRAHTHSRTSKNSVSDACNTRSPSNTPTQKIKHTAQNVHTPQQRHVRGLPSTYTQKNTHSAQHISKQLRTHKQKSQDTHAPRQQCTHTLQNIQTQSHIFRGNITHTLEHAHIQENANTFQNTSVSCRTLRSHKTHNTLLQLNSKYTESITESAQHGSLCQHTHAAPTAGPTRTLRSQVPSILSGQYITSLFWSVLSLHVMTKSQLLESQHGTWGIFLVCRLMS